MKTDDGGGSHEILSRLRTLIANRDANGEQRIANGTDRYSLLPTRHSLRLAAGLFPGLRNLHAGIDLHQPDLVRQRHELEAHVDGADGAFGAAAMDTGIEAALAAFLHDLLIDLEDLRLVAVELRHETIGETEVGRPDVYAVDAFNVENGFHVLDRRPGLHP